VEQRPLREEGVRCLILSRKSAISSCVSWRILVADDVSEAPDLRTADLLGRHENSIESACDTLDAGQDRDASQLVSPSSRARLEPPDGWHTIDIAIERSDGPDAGQLRAGCEIRLGEVDPVLLVDLEGAQEQRFVSHSHRREADDRTDELGLAGLYAGEREQARLMLEQALDLCLELNRGQTEAEADCLSGLAALAGLEGDIDRAARLFGAAEAAREALGVVPSPSVRPIYERLLPEIAADADEQVLASSWQRGRLQSTAEAAAWEVHDPV
jgi:hypothetical protein